MAKRVSAPTHPLPTVVVAVENLKVNSVDVLKSKTEICPEPDALLFRLDPYQEGDQSKLAPEGAEPPPGWLNPAIVSGRVSVSYKKRDGKVVEVGSFPVVSPSTDSTVNLLVPITEELVQLIGENWTDGRFILNFGQLVESTQIPHDCTEIRIVRIGGGGPSVLDHDGKGNISNEIPVKEEILRKARSSLLRQVPSPSIHGESLTAVRKLIAENKAAKATINLRTFVVEKLCDPSGLPKGTAPKHVIKDIYRKAKLDRVDGPAKAIVERVLSDLDGLLEKVLDVLNAHCHDDKVTNEPDPATIDLAWSSVVSVVTYLAT